MHLQFSSHHKFHFLHFYARVSHDHVKFLCIIQKPKSKDVMRSKVSLKVLKTRFIWFLECFANRKPNCHRQSKICFYLLLNKFYPRAFGYNIPKHSKTFYVLTFKLFKISFEVYTTPSQLMATIKNSLLHGSQYVWKWRNVNIY